MKKYVEDKQIPNKKKKEEEKAQDKANNGCKWVKTDSECKLLFKRTHTHQKNFYDHLLS